MMETQQPLAIVRGGRLANRSAGGNRSYAGVRGLIHYIAYGRHQFGQADKQERGVWLDHTGQEKPHESVLQWAKDKVHHYGYDFSYQLLLSTRYGGLTAADFNQVMQQGSAISQAEEWRLMVHEDTGNQHAHVILLRQEKMSKEIYKQWQQVMQAELAQLQAGRWQEQQLQAESALAEARQAQQRQAEMALAEAPRLQRGWEVGL